MYSFENNPENQELCAELLLSTYFEQVDDWNSQYGSFFSRNYSGDLKDVHPESKTVVLSRNGIYDILPEKMFFDLDELRFMEPRDFALRVSEMYEEKKNIQDYFKPFDSFFFNQSLRLFKVVGHIVNHRTALLLRLLYDYDIEKEENRFVRQLAPLLIHVTELRSEIGVLSNVLAEILECHVDYHILHQDNEVMFIVHKRNLSSKEYITFMNELKPLFDFVNLWFIPMNMDCNYKVKDYQQCFVLSSDKPLVLDYNTQI